MGKEAHDNPLWACFSDGVGAALFEQDIVAKFDDGAEVVGNSMVAVAGLAPAT
jgi:hypothetical protein